MCGSKDRGSGSHTHFGQSKQTWIGYAYGEKLIEDVANNFNGVRTRLIADRVSLEKFATSDCGGFSYFRMIVFKIRHSTAAHKFIESVA
jgi:hypothetical protein